MDNKEIDAIINSDSFKKSLRDAIESGIETDWGYNGEDEVPFDTFNKDEAFEEVMRILTLFLL